MTVASTTNKLSRIEQCQKNAQEKSDKKRQAFTEALASMVQQGLPLVKAQVCKCAGVSAPFLRAHPDLAQLLEDAQRKRLASKEQVAADASAVRSKERIIEALKRQLDAKQTVIDAKEAALREKDRTIEVLFGKLAASAPLSDSDLRNHLQDQTRRAERAEARVKDLESRLFAKRVVRMRDAARRADQRGSAPIRKG
jgi:hypothetical protein